ncbi:hypothetical protein HPB50_006551 [Hyalomma asiaticum]|uniref:Uncharacterized protein n=1 Tax=Hyalomma asiaticum TaxID=266040 RepID=A0ACB7T3P5_HYAAI|nr:hypothetical protein HPB50_006551 [Hyalomma asiaticum]
MRNLFDDRPDHPVVILVMTSEEQRRLAGFFLLVLGRPGSAGAPPAAPTTAPPGKVVSLPPGAPAARLCHLVRRPDFDGYGFNLHADKQRKLQYVGAVDPGSPAETAGLRANDTIVEVNGVNVEGTNHRDIVERIKSVPNETRLLVVDDGTAAWYREHGIAIRGDLPNVIQLSSVKAAARRASKPAAVAQEAVAAPQSWPNFDGYGFNLHADKKRQGHFIGQVDPGSPAELGGLRKNDRLLEVNGLSVEGESHREIIERIKHDPTQVELLVIDREADEAFAKRKQKPSSQSESVVRRRTPAQQPGTEQQHQQAIRDVSAAASGSQVPSASGGSPAGDAVGKPPRVKQGKHSRQVNQVNNSTSKVAGRETSKDAISLDATTSSTASQMKQHSQEAVTVKKDILVFESGKIADKAIHQVNGETKDEVIDHRTDQANGPAATATCPRDNKRQEPQSSHGTRGPRDENKTEPRVKTREDQDQPSPRRFSRHHQQSPNDAYGWSPQNDFASTTADGYSWPFVESQQPWYPYGTPFPAGYGSFPPPYAAAPGFPPPPPSSFNPFPQFPHVPYQPNAVYWPCLPIPAYCGFPIVSYPPPPQPDLAYPSPYSTFSPFASAAPTGPVPQEQSRVHRDAEARADEQTPGGAARKRQY